MASTVKQRLRKWNKIAKPRHHEDVTFFSEWLKKSREQIIEEYYSIEKFQFSTRLFQPYRDHLRRIKTSTKENLNLAVEKQPVSKLLGGGGGGRMVGVSVSLFTKRTILAA